MCFFLFVGGSIFEIGPDNKVRFDANEYIKNGLKINRSRSRKR